MKSKWLLGSDRGTEIFEARSAGEQITCYRNDKHKRASDLVSGCDKAGRCIFPLSAVLDSHKDISVGKLV